MTTIGRYEILDELGTGATAAVFLAYDPYVKRQVAVKVMSYGRVDDPLFEHFFQQEAEAIAALDHPATAEVYDFGLHGEQLYMVTRYFPGGTLMDRLKTGYLPPKALLTLFSRMGGTLDEAHERGIIHCDVKPSNILYDQDEQAYLADFGLAQIASHMPSTMTESLLIGTPHFMSPEQIRRDELDGRTDIYALGVVLFLCLTRRYPYPYKNPKQVAKAHLKADIPSVKQHKADLPDWWDEIIQKALAKDRTARYQTAKALADDVELAATRRWHLRALH